MPRGLKRLLLTCGALGLLTACASRTAPEVRLEEPVEDVDILHALLRSAQVPISTDPFCTEIAAPNTRTVGRFVAGLLAAHEPDRRNWMQIWTDSGFPPDQMNVFFISGIGERNWLDWGVRFQLMPTGDRVVDPASFRCFTSWTP
jgi:hypothetical protein